MGFQTSTTIALLMTLFNVRLGWWVGNPGPWGTKTYRRSSPRWSLIRILQEALGLTIDRRSYVYLSDGGHFENLGLYEMVRRRCRIIVVSDAGQDSLRRIIGSTVRMGQLIDGLLNLSRVTRAEVRGRSVDLSSLAGELVAELRSGEDGRQVECVIAKGAVVEGDPALLRAALQNLIGNAWKFTRKRASARIEFGFAEEAGERTYFVRDNGAGFEMSYSDKLFGAFQRLHGQDEFPGIGIGLATVQRIVTRHGGRVWAIGAPGEGATVYFTLGKGGDIGRQEDRAAG